MHSGNAKTSRGIAALTFLSLLMLVVGVSRPAPPGCKQQRMRRS